MEVYPSLPISIFLLVGSLFTHSKAAIFQIQNNCAFTVWAASVPVGGGKRLDHGQVWNISVPYGTKQGRIWARTGCSFDTTGRGRCETGDCNGILECQSFGTPPNTLAEYALNQFDNLDFFDMSLVDGFNVPMDFRAVNLTATSNACNQVEFSGNEFKGKNFYISLGDGLNGQGVIGGKFQFSSTSSRCSSRIRCTGDINGQCPDELKAPGGCNNPCTVFKTNEYCCTSSSCGPTDYSNFFKDRCPDAYSYPKDDQTSTFTCPGGTHYVVVFCP